MRYFKEYKLLADKLSRRIWLVFQISFFDSRALFALSASSCLCSSVSVRLLYGFLPNLNSKSGHWGAEQDLTMFLSPPQHSIQNSFIAINGDVGLSFPFLSLISNFKSPFQNQISIFNFWIEYTTLKSICQYPNSNFKIKNGNRISESYIRKSILNLWFIYMYIDIIQIQIHLQ